MQFMLANEIIYRLRTIFVAFLCLFIMSCGRSKIVTEEFASSITLEFIQEWSINDISLVPNPRYFGVLDDTSIILADRSTKYIGHFSSNSEFVQKFGGSGRGPGEYSGMDAFALHPNGYVGIADMANARVTITNLNSGHLVYFDFESGWDNQLFWAGDQLILTNAPFRRGANDSVPIAMQSFDYATNTSKELFSFNIPTNPEPNGFIGCMYCKHTITDDLMYITAPSDTSYKVIINDFKSDEVRILSRSGAPLVALTDEEKEQIRSQRAQAASMIGLPPVRTEIPQYRKRINHLFSDHKDRVWVSIEVPKDEPGLFDVFSDAGEYLGSVRLPDASYKLVYSKNDVILFSTGYTDETGWTGRAYRISD